MSTLLQWVGEHPVLVVAVVAILALGGKRIADVIRAGKGG